MTRNDFKRIPELRKEINRALILWENALESATRTTTLITGMPKGNGTSSQVENAIIKAETLKARYDELCDELKDIYTRLRNDSKRVLNEQESKVLNRVYVQNKHTKEIAEELKLTERHVYRLKKSALYKICW